MIYGIPIAEYNINIKSVFNITLAIIQQALVISTTYVELVIEKYNCS